LHVGEDRTVVAAPRPETIVGALAEKRNLGSVDVSEVGFRAVPDGRRRSGGERREHVDAVVDQPAAGFPFTQSGVPGPCGQVLGDVLTLRPGLAGGEAGQVEAVFDQIPDARINPVLAAVAKHGVQDAQKGISSTRRVCP
jgi:hypothetical protein